MRSPAVQAGLVIVALAVILNVVAVLVDALAPSPSGPASSSLATSREGLAAWADLLRGSGRRVEALRDPPSDATLPERGTVVLLDPDRVDDDEAAALARFVARGGRLVAGGRAPGSWVETAAGVDGLEWDGGGPRTARVLAPAPETAGVAAVRTAKQGAWTAAGGALPALGDGDDSLLLLARAGPGSVALLADASPLQNRLLDEDDNAALALALAGRGPVTFVESVHGYGAARGLAALPGRFRWALILLALAALAFMLARGRRFGPPERERRELPPPRRAYVDALAAALARGGDREAAVAPVRAAVRARLGRSTPAEAGLDAAAARALTDGTEDDDDVIAAGRALALLQRKGR